MERTSSDEYVACEAAAEVFQALSSASRLLILRRLAVAPACVHELVEELGFSQPLVSQHLRVLRQVDLVKGTRRGRETTYELADHHVAHIVADTLAHITESSGRGSDSDALDEQPRDLEPQPDEEHPS